MQLDLTDAIDAGADSNFDRGNDSRSEIAAHVINAALPHILNALADEAESLYEEASDDAYGAFCWLRTKAEEAQHGG